MAPFQSRGLWAASAENSLARFLALVLLDVGVDDVADVVAAIFVFDQGDVVFFIFVVVEFDVFDFHIAVGIDHRHASVFDVLFGFFFLFVLVFTGGRDLQRRFGGDLLDDALFLGFFVLGLRVIVIALLIVGIGSGRNGW